VTAGLKRAPNKNCRTSKPRGDVLNLSRDEESVLGALLPHSFEFSDAPDFARSKGPASRAPRMVAMKKCDGQTRKQIIKDLTLEYNKLAAGEHHERSCSKITTAQMAVG